MFASFLWPKRKNGTAIFLFLHFSFPRKRRGKRLWLNRNEPTRLKYRQSFHSVVTPSNYQFSAWVSTPPRRSPVFLVHFNWILRIIPLTFFAPWAILYTSLSWTLDDTVWNLGPTKTISTAYFFKSGSRTCKRIIESLGCTTSNFCFEMRGWFVLPKSKILSAKLVKSQRLSLVVVNHVQQIKVNNCT